MAKEAALKDVSKQELAESYSKLKARTKNAQVQAKTEGEALVKDALTVASGGGLGYLMGQRRAEAADAAAKAGHAEGSEEYEQLVAEGGQVAGIDLDLLAGGAAAAAGLLKLGGKMSDTVRAIGIGGLTAYAARVGYEKGEDSVTEVEAE